MSLHSRKRSNSDLIESKKKIKLLDNRIHERSIYDKYFFQLEKSKQIEILEKEDEIYNFYNDKVPLRYRILYSDLSNPIKFFILQKIDFFDSLSTDNSEYHKLSKWIYGISLIPFNVYIDLPISISDKSHKIKDFLVLTYEKLEKTIYGQYQAKNKIIEIMAQWISNPKSKSQIIALEGPPGVGKTSLIKEGVSVALNRPFSFYALGGASDITSLEGHSYTYEGASWGRIVEMLMESKVMNPIIFFDELDKISSTSRGNEINGLLIHLTDPAQNNIFQDKYFSGINLDLSRILFFFSFNDINKINPILKDRLTIIKFNSYKLPEKIEITRKFLIPDILKNIGIQQEDIIISEEIIKYIIRKIDNEEPGMRKIKKYFEDIFLKINLIRFMENSEIKIEFPFEITDNIINKLT